MADFTIGINTERFDFIKMFDSCDLDILASERIYVSYIDGSTVRKTPSKFVIMSSSPNGDLSQDPSSTINSTDFRIGERVVIRDLSNQIIGFGIVNATYSSKINISILYGEITIPPGSYLDVTTDDYIDENRAVKLNTETTPFLMMASTTGGTIDISIENNYRLKKKVKIGSYGGSGGGDTYTNGSPTPSSIGGISAGSTFLNQTMKQMWDALLYPYQAPAFTSFSVPRNMYEIAETIDNPMDYSWSTSNSSNVQPNDISLYEGSNLRGSGLANDGFESISNPFSVGYGSEYTLVFKIESHNSQGTLFSRTYNAYWRWRMYYGEGSSGPLVESDIKSLRASLLTNTKNRTYAMQAGSTYKYIAYPKIWGLANSFTDANSGFAVAMEAPYIVNVTNDFGANTDFYVYRTTNVLNSATNIIVA